MDQLDSFRDNWDLIDINSFIDEAPSRFLLERSNPQPQRTTSDLVWKLSCFSPQKGAETIKIVHYPFPTRKYLNTLLNHITEKYHAHRGTGGGLKEAA
ncbi:hypothetical protein RND71_020494 [Anisodus tanguticus]|uniref:Uncharacterized protein n=1 Tax=Anisodus tanguticus TaxID=243964 RepID=A0AAE1S1L9_9SOLA|nr:hypothetical protein RND71_020494 [Anisodus tanguticus]